MVSGGSDWRCFSARVEAVDDRGVDALSDRYGGNPLSQSMDPRSEPIAGHVHRKCDQRGASCVAFHAAGYSPSELVAAPGAGRTLVDQPGWVRTGGGFVRGGNCGFVAFSVLTASSKTQ